MNRYQTGKLKKKILLLGKSDSGKTSMKSIIFDNCTAIDTKHFCPTIDVEYSHIKFFGNFLLNLWDCGGVFMQSYLSSQRVAIFQNADAFIYVFDAQSQDEEWKKDLKNYQLCLNAVFEHSSAPKVVCLLHKMDLIPKDERDKVFLERENEIISLSKLKDCVCYQTSIWNETLFKAWSLSLRKLIPNVKELDKCVQQFGNIIKGNEVLLFDRTTLLVISSYKRVLDEEDTSGQLSFLLKKFKLSCSKVEDTLKWMNTHNKTFTLVIRDFTANTYFMAVFSDPEIPSTLISVNIDSARKRFEELENENLVDQFSDSINLF